VQVGSAQAAAHAPLRHDTGMGNTVIICSWVCSVMGAAQMLPYLGNTVPLSMVLWVCRYWDFGQVSDHLTLLIHS
jgi:hypothetical protein